MLCVKSAKVWNYLVLCTRVHHVRRAFSRDRDIEFSDKSVARWKERGRKRKRTLFYTIFAQYHCLQHALIHVQVQLQFHAPLTRNITHRIFVAVGIVCEEVVYIYYIPTREREKQPFWKMYLNCSTILFRCVLIYDN